jgi:hypothetical protein
MKFFGNKKLSYLVIGPKRMKIFTSRGDLEELGESSEKETFEDDCNNHSLKMSLVNDNDFHKAIPTTPLFNVHATPYVPICSFWWGARHVVGDSLYRSNKVSITNPSYLFWCPV